MKYFGISKPVRKVIPIEPVKPIEQEATPLATFPGVKPKRPPRARDNTASRARIPGYQMPEDRQPVTGCYNCHHVHVYENKGKGQPRVKTHFGYYCTRYRVMVHRLSICAEFTTPSN